jgi:hypothetical protein
MYVSQDFRMSEAKAFTEKSALYWMLLSALLSVIHLQLYLWATEVIRALEQTEDFGEAIHQWPSVFSGMQLIANRMTHEHWDFKSQLEWYDILVIIGPYLEAWMTVPNIRVWLKYDSSTVISLSGQVLQHAVQSFNGERVCYADFMRSNVHERMRVCNSGWSTVKGIVDTYL